MTRSSVSLTAIMLLLVASGTAQAQQPRYTEKHFVRNVDTTEFKSSGPVQNGPIKAYIQTPTIFFDVDDNNSTHIRAQQVALICFEGNVVNGKKQGIVRKYLIDSADHSKRYLFEEQLYKDDQLNGETITYNLRGTRVMVTNFQNNKQNGINRTYQIDGKTPLHEREIFAGTNRTIERTFFPNGKLSEEVNKIDNIPNGEIKSYYETGVLKDKFNVKNGERDGLRIYYYPNGNPWIEQTYKNNKAWTIIANYDSKGNKRNGGTLKDGNGTVIFYEDDTTVREIITYKNGEQLN